MATTFNGKCHCGEVEWTVSLEKEQQAHVLCHCPTCQVLGGGAFSLNQVVPKKAFKLTKGELKTYTYKGASGNPTHCYFCGTCTASPYHHQTVMGEDNIVLRTILLDGGKGFQPAAELWGKSRLPWVVEVAQTFEGAPPG